MTKADRLRAFEERRLSREELDAYVNAPMSQEEREDMLSLMRWFRRRYPTPAARSRYARDYCRRVAATGAGVRVARR